MCEFVLSVLSQCKLPAVNKARLLLTSDMLRMPPRTPHGRLKEIIGYLNAERGAGKLKWDIALLGFSSVTALPTSIGPTLPSLPEHLGGSELVSISA